MAKTIDKILEDLVVPEMEYEPKYDVGKSRSKTRERVAVTIDEIPEVVLPKTKAEMYREAKGRLKAETSAASKRSASHRAPKSAAKVKTVELEIAAVSNTAERAESDNVKSLLEQFKRPLDEPIWVGGAEELVPFAWRNPLVADIKKPNKYYRQAVRESRSALLPALRDK